jgi:hypothetical protein
MHISPTLNKNPNVSQYIHTTLTQHTTQGLEEVTASVADYPRLRIAYVIPGSPNWVAGPGYVTEVTL